MERKPVKKKTTNVIPISNQVKVPTAPRTVIRNWVPTEEERRKVSLLVSTGLSIEEIARVINPGVAIEHKALRRRFKTEIADAKNAIRLELLEKAFEVAYSGKPGSHAVLIFLNKAISGLRDFGGGGEGGKEKDAATTAAIMQQKAEAMQATMPAMPEPKPQEEEVSNVS